MRKRWQRARSSSGERRGTERSRRDLQEAHPDNGQEEVNVGSWRCVGRKHQAVHPLRVTKSNAETTGDLMRLRKVDKAGASFLARLRHQPIRGRRQRVRGGETCKTPRAASPGGMPEVPGKEGQTKSLVGKWHHALRGERMARWQRGGF